MPLSETHSVGCINIDSGQIRHTFSDEFGFYFTHFAICFWYKECARTGSWQECFNIRGLKFQ
jgi:hypothetical protein